MHKLSTRILQAAIMLIAACPILQLAVAQMSGGGMKGAPFVAAESETTSKLTASTVSNAKRNPYFAKTNADNVAEGNYNGIVITPDDSPFPDNLKSIRFDYKGSDKSMCFVDYRPAVGSWTRSCAALSNAQLLSTSKDGYKTVQLTGQQLGISSNSLIKRITIVPPAQKSAGRFLADAIYVNDSPVRKVMNSLFFKVADASPTGPAGFSINPSKTPVATGFFAAAAAKKQASGVTQFVIRNSTKTDQNVWLTLGAGLPPNAITTPDQIPLNVVSSGSSTPVTWQISGSPLQNYFILPAGENASSALTTQQPFVSNLVITFGAPNFNCSNASYPQFPQGMTLVEFTINTYPWSNDYSHPETMDISENGGNNAFYDVFVGGQNQEKWLVLKISNSLGTTYRSAQNRFSNYCLNDNYENPGVYPYGCNNCVVNNPVLSDNCSNLTNTTCNPSNPPAPATPTISADEICQVNRLASCGGGTILIRFNGYDPSTIVQPGPPAYPAPILQNCPKPKIPKLKQQANSGCTP